MMEKNIQEALKEALKSGQKVKVSALRMLISEIKNRKIADRVEELDDEKVIGIIQKMVRRHEESIEKFTEGGRDDLVSKETEEMSIVEKYLPEQIPEEELRRIIFGSIERTGATSVKDMGKVMKDVIGSVKGRADGKTINRIIREKLT